MKRLMAYIAAAVLVCLLAAMYIFHIRAMGASPRTAIICFAIFAVTAFLGFGLTKLFSKRIRKKLEEQS